MGLWGGVVSASDVRVYREDSVRTSSVGIIFIVSGLKHISSDIAGCKETRVAIC